MMVQVVRGVPRLHIYKKCKQLGTQMNPEGVASALWFVFTQVQRISKTCGLTEYEEKLSNPPPGMEKQSPDQARLQTPNLYLLS